MNTEARIRTILGAAARLIINQGYDKTTIGDVADEAGLNRVLLYQHFKSKDDLLEALIARELRRYSQIWLEHLLEDPRGGTIASIHRSIAYALNQCPFMTAIVTRDEHTFGKYLRKPGNIFEAAQSISMTQDFLQALQEAGVVRQGVNIPAMAYIMDVISYGMIEGRKDSSAKNAPPYNELLETVAEMYDRMLTPDDGGNLEAGKRIIQQLADNARASFPIIDSEEER